MRTNLARSTPSDAFRFRTVLPGILIALFAPAGSKGQSPPTFNRDIAPIIFKQCATCHRSGQPAPFSLLSYEDVRKRAKEIVQVTHERFMPPWLPEPGQGEFAGERRLTTNEIELIARWVNTGAAEGEAIHLPAAPIWPEGWVLGKPDLVVTMPEAYTLGAEGKDVYRNFIIPVPIREPRYIRAIEFRPGNPRIVHHAVVQIDRTSLSRELDQRDPSPGFSGFMTGGAAHPPDGNFLGWTPGKAPSQGVDGIAWECREGTDLVLQLHLRPSGKSETIRSSIGLYFAQSPPTRHPYALVVRNKFIDIPPGESDYLVEQEYELPVDLEVLSIYPHAHFLGKQMKATALQPRGEIVPLLSIKDWDFNWQDEYRYKHPLSLPKGTRIRMDYRYDNSETNPRNPHQPPKRVVYGRNSTDEMAELMLQVLPRDLEDLAKLRRDVADKALLEDIARREHRLRTSPGTTTDFLFLGTRYQQLGRHEEAVKYFRQAVELSPASAEAQYLLGDSLAQKGQLAAALPHLQEAVRFAPNRPEPLNALARVLATASTSGAGDRSRAIELAERAAEITRHSDPGILETLMIAYAEAGRMEEAERTAKTAVRLANDSQAPELADRIAKRLKTYNSRVTTPRE